MSSSILGGKLQSVYGSSQQKSRYSVSLDAFYAKFGAGPVNIYRAPGRVNLIGEHTDYNHGYVMPVALDKDVLLLARPRSDSFIHLENVEHRFPPLRFRLGEEIPIEQAGDWGNYARGVSHSLGQHQGLATSEPSWTGFDGLVVGAAPWGVPRGAGLSSSSALTVVIAMALAHINQWQLTDAELIQLCSDAEWHVGTRGGIMDHVIALLASKDHALFLDCRPDEAGNYATVHLPLPAGYSLLIINSGVKHENVSGDFNRRVAACRAGVALLQRHYPQITHLRDLETIPWKTISPLLPRQTSLVELADQGIDLDKIPGISPETILKVHARCRHVWTENQRVLRARQALQQHDIVSLGRLLNKAHASARDDYEISCPELEALVTLLDRQPSVLGARLTGAGWGGCVVALVEKASVEKVSQDVTAGYQAETGLEADSFICSSGPGAGLMAAFN